MSRHKHHRAAESSRSTSRSRLESTQHSTGSSGKAPLTDTGGDDEGHYEGQPGALLNNDYVLQQDVGMGTFGRVIECWDKQKKRYVAVKVVRRVKRYCESADIEARILRDVNRQGSRGTSLCVELLDTFEMSGHYCLVFERMGSSLYDLLKRNSYQGFPLHMVRDFARQLLDAVSFLHGMGLIHTDLKPENVLLCDTEVHQKQQRSSSSTAAAAGASASPSDSDRTKGNSQSTSRHRDDEDDRAGAGSAPLWLPASTRIKGEEQLSVLLS